MRTRAMGTLALAVMAFAVVAPLQAQGPRRGAGAERNLGEQLTMLTERLDLTEEQAVSVGEILEAQAGKHRESSRAGGGDGDRAERHASMQGIRDETMELFAEVLSEGQFLEFQKIHEEMHPGKKGPPPTH